MLPLESILGLVSVNGKHYNTIVDTAIIEFKEVYGVNQILMDKIIEKQNIL